MTTEIPVELRKWQHLCWKIAEEHGWHRESLTSGPGEVNFINVAAQLALIHSEVSEALEEVRRGKINTYHDPTVPFDEPIGFAIELADIIMRVLDLAQSLGLDMQTAMELKIEYNKGRTYRHGGKLF